MSKKKDKKKSDEKKEKIELKEISAEEPAALPFAAPQKSRAKKPVEQEDVASIKPGCKVKVIPALNGKKDNGYEEMAASVLNETIAEGYELLCIVPSANAKKLVAFFKLSK